MLHRHLSVPLHRSAYGHETVLVQGPRGAGKTTLLRRDFPGHTYASLEDSAERARARQNPGDYLAKFRGPAIVDDLHRAPELVSWLAQQAAPHPIIFASSRRLRVPMPTMELHMPTRAERQRRPALSLEMLGRFVPAKPVAVAEYPQWKPARGFLESDVRDLVSVHDMDRFEQFLAAAKRQSGAVLDQQALANDCGVSHRTVVRWIEILDACFLILRLAPSDFDGGRRLIRRPKLHFLDSELFESRVVSELFRNAKHAGEAADLRFWRDSNGMEIPLIIQQEGVAFMPVSIAEAATPRETALLRRWLELAGVGQGALISDREGAARGGSIQRYSFAQL
jgi:predicted AAA+ superfamily ATPase